MPSHATLPPERLRRTCDPASFAFETTAELGDGAEIVGQPRAMESVRFGVGIDQDGFNIFAYGPTGTGKHYLIAHYLAEVAAKEPVPDDTCYVHNFEEPHRPQVLRVPAGRATQLQADMTEFVESVRTSLTRAMESDEYLSRRRVIDQEFEELPEQAFDAVREQAKERNLAMLKTPVGIVFAPLKSEDEVLPPEEFKQLPQEERDRIEADVESLQKEVQKILRQTPTWERQAQEKLRELNREITTHAVGHLIDDLRATYADLPQVLAFFDAIQADIVDHAEDILHQKTPTDPASMAAQIMVSGPTEPAPLYRYQVNVIVDNAALDQAPVVYEENPTYVNLLGRIEHIAQMGALVTDYHLIRPGALHRANGGYLILDARAVLTQPFAWEALKRSLRTKQARIESLGQSLSLVSTVSLEPEPVALDVKVVLLAEPLIYHLLSAYDPEVPELFKVGADFQNRMDRDGESELLYARHIASIVDRFGLRPLDRAAVARTIDRSARLAGDSEKLTVHTESIADLLREADYWAGVAESPLVLAEHVQKAVDAQTYRSDRLREVSQEAILRDLVYIDTEGEKVGQVNGLSVLQLGSFAFGRPSRITARTRMGKGEVVDIEREVELGGPIHSKGVLILASFLSARYAVDEPLSLSASLVFEQSYGGVEGDSASSAELYAILSSVADLPIKQSFAVTGSVNQHGQVQPIGGVNEKIEGFFDICRERGLTGDQGVLIPSANVVHLMLREDVVEAAAEGRFHVHAVDTVDQGIELLTGVPAGERGEDGQYPPDSVNGLVEARLRDLAEKRRAASAEIRGGDA